MLYTNSAYLKNISLHIVGNKQNEENVHIAKSLLQLHDEVRDILSLYFLSSFKSNEYFIFFHDSDLKYNEVYGFVTDIFNQPDSLYENSVRLAKHLYEQSTHPKIKGGEFYTVYFKGCIIDGETVDAVGLFKSENKDTFLKVFSSGEDFEIESEKGVNINKLDKGCLIFNTEKEKGYVVAVVDNTNKGADAQYWIDHFLHVRQRKDEYYNTQNVMSLCKNFVKTELPQQFEVSKADQVDFLNKSVQFFKENDNFNLNEFANEVIRQPEIIESFNQYKSSFQKDFDIEIADNFMISESAVKKQSRTLKSVIKLDKNFDIYIHGNRDLMEQGEDKKGKYYKVYYKEES
ncbi:nucleoid-associated protein [Parabacteroides sp. Marseille-P3160]|uniref:nucleoid-associated protein n=1 Tax=Parabacteroides sp. Marseille-P3160 TaxID=1917887 RepID=UPI0009BA3236|nr:nucleoid-associated protein [Parabacteroides sp. Marseille-P3160]